MNEIRACRVCKKNVNTSKEYVDLKHDHSQEVEFIQNLLSLTLSEMVSV